MLTVEKYNKAAAIAATEDNSSAVVAEYITMPASLRRADHGGICRAEPESPAGNGRKKHHVPDHAGRLPDGPSGRNRNRAFRLTFSALRCKIDP